MRRWSGWAWNMGHILYKIIDVVVVLLCLPFYAVAIPLAYLLALLPMTMREPRLGQEIVHWPAQTSS